MELSINDLTLEALPHLLLAHPTEELPAFIALCGLSPQSKELTLAAVQMLDTASQLERAGMGLSVSQSLHLLDEHRQFQLKLPPLFVGMRREIFDQLLLEANTEQLEVLKHESILEPIQHHLTLLCHELNTELNHIDIAVDAFEKKLELLEVDSIYPSDILHLRREVNGYSDAIAKIQQRCSPAIALAWNTTRMDLIEKLSKLREQTQRYRLMVIGNDSQSPNGTSGLYAKLEEKLNGIFGEAQDDAEPAMEAMVKFSVWYLKDYWEIGLLPEIQDEKELEQQERDTLFQKVRENLEGLGLRTLGDLKERSIFSKHCLQDFIRNRVV